MKTGGWAGCEKEEGCPSPGSSCWLQCLQEKKGKLRRSAPEPELYFQTRTFQTRRLTFHAESIIILLFYLVVVDVDLSEDDQKIYIHTHCVSFFSPKPFSGHAVLHVFCQSFGPVALRLFSFRSHVLKWLLSTHRDLADPKERSVLTAAGERFQQAVQADLHAVGGAVAGRQLQLLQGFSQVVCKHEWGFTLSPRKPDRTVMVFLITPVCCRTHEVWAILPIRTPFTLVGWIQ